MTNFAKLMLQQVKMFAPPKQELYLDSRKFNMDYDFTINDKPESKEVNFTLYNAFNIQVKQIKLIIGGIIIFEGYVNDVTEDYTDTDIILKIGCLANNTAIEGLTNVKVINKGDDLNNYFPSNLKNYKTQNIIDLSKIKGKTKKLQKIAQIEKLGGYTIKDGTTKSVIFSKFEEQLGSINNIIYFNIKSAKAVDTDKLHQELVLKCLLNPFVYTGQKIKFQDKIYVINSNKILYKSRSEGLIQEINAYDENYINYLASTNLAQGEDS